MRHLLLLSTLLLLPLIQLLSQVGRYSQTPLIGVEAPSFSAQSTNGTINFPEDFGANWKILFSHPKDFTPVCSSELLELAHHQDSFDQLSVKLVVLSTDNLDQHKSWKKALEEISYKDRDPVKIKFPLIDDESYKVSRLYGMIHPEASINENIRGVFIIDPENKVRAIYYYPNEIGRNIDELKRTVMALQATYNNRNIVIPANWQPGDDYMVPVVTALDREKLGEPDSPFYEKSWFMIYKKQQE